MNLKKIVAKLSSLERKLLPILEPSEKTTKELSENSGMKEVEVTRAAQWLNNKSLAKISTEKNEVLNLGVNGKRYLREGLPEKKFLKAIKSGPKSLGEISESEGLDRNELNICIGLLKKKSAIELKKGKELVVKITDRGKKIIKDKCPEEKFLGKDFPLRNPSFNKEEKEVFRQMIRRKGIICKEEEKVKKISLTKEGEKVKKMDISNNDFIDQLTPKMLRKGTWKNKKFREYDVEINVPSFERGKRHFVSQAISSAKRIWMDMGFREMKGDIVQPSFWNFDALFTAQDHPVRDMQDTFFIADPKRSKLPHKGMVNKVRKVHEHGADTESKGWGYKWKKEEAEKNVLRTHTTVLSARTLAELNKKDLPAKFFSFGRCFRNETLDWSHLFEFNQTDGIVVDPNANFRHLLGYLKSFFRKMGYGKARFRPAYFPYTEPSVEIDVYNEKREEWVELGGAGILRPEVVKPLLGINAPVLAWGPGFDRIILEFFKIEDIRDLYKNDISQLRKMKEWTR